MSKKIVEATTKIVEPIAVSLGFEVLDIEYVKQPTGYHLTVTIDKEGGVTIDDCETVHRAIDQPLDGLDALFHDGYFLNVSSPGIDRPLKNAKDFLRNTGKEIEVKFWKPENGKKILVGRLVSFTDTDFVLEAEGVQQTIDKKTVANIVPYLNMTALLKEKELLKK